MRSDAALAERFVAGDEAAFDVIYERHRPVVLAVCMGVLGTPHDAEDATQETFSSLAQALLTSPPAEIRPWLIRVARNASIDATRRRKHRLLTMDGEIPEIPARQPTGSAELETVMTGIRELPENQRTALLMRELGGHSYVQIAKLLETDEDSVRGLIARARVGLRSYREAAELPCSIARAEIETEPDGRRYDKAVRRHLKICTPCHQYRNALRGDARALRAALPLQTGSVIGTGALSAGAFSAAKASMAGMALTQIAATGAATVCAIGAVGGLMVMDTGHQLLGFEAGKAASVVKTTHTVAIRGSSVVSHPAKKVSHGASAAVHSTHADVTSGSGSHRISGQPTHTSASRSWWKHSGLGVRWSRHHSGRHFRYNGIGNDLGHRSSGSGWSGGVSTSRSNGNSGNLHTGSGTTGSGNHGYAGGSSTTGPSGSSTGNQGGDGNNGGSSSNGGWNGHGNSGHGNGGGWGDDGASNSGGDSTGGYSSGSSSTYSGTSTSGDSSGGSSWSGASSNDGSGAGSGSTTSSGGGSNGYSGNGGGSGHGGNGGWGHGDSGSGGSSGYGGNGNGGYGDGGGYGNGGAGGHGGGY